MKEKLILSKKLKGEDGYKTFSIRIKEETVEKIDALSDMTNRTRNELIGILLEYAIENCEVKWIKAKRTHMRPFFIFSNMFL